MLLCDYIVVTSVCVFISRRWYSPTKPTLWIFNILVLSTRKWLSENRETRIPACKQRSRLLKMSQEFYLFKIFLQRLTELQISSWCDKFFNELANIQQHNISSTIAAKYVMSSADFHCWREALNTEMPLAWATQSQAIIWAAPSRRKHFGGN